VLEGSRPLLLEIQALVAPTDLAMPRRVGTGVDPKRLAMIVAVLSRQRPRIALGQADVFVNVAAACASTSPAPTWRSRWQSFLRRQGGRRTIAERRPPSAEDRLTGRLRPSDPVRAGRLEECGCWAIVAAIAPAGTPSRGKMHVLEAETC
jgi:DNA repair protein RadA/Sms